MEKKFSIDVGDGFADNGANAGRAGVPCLGIEGIWREAGDANSIIFSERFLKKHPAATTVGADGDKMKVGLFYILVGKEFSEREGRGIGAVFSSFWGDGYNNFGGIDSDFEQAGFCHFGVGFKGLEIVSGIDLASGADNFGIISCAI